MSKLFRNVPIVNFLEMSPSWVVVFSLEYALKRSPVVRAKRKCVFQRAALRSPGVRNPGLHVLISLPPRMVVLSFPHHTGSGDGRIWLNGFSYGFLQLDKGYPLPAVAHLDGSLLPFADQSLALRRSKAPLPRPQL